MTTLIFYILLCTTTNGEQECSTFEPMSWEIPAGNESYSNEQEREQAFRECEILVNAYDQLQATKETDCYVQE